MEPQWKKGTGIIPALENDGIQIFCRIHRFLEQMVGGFCHDATC